MKNYFWTLFAAILFFAIGTPVAAQNFGGAVALAGSDVIVGQSGANSTNSSVYVYRNMDGEWAEAGQLVRSDNDGQDDRFGRSISSDGNVLLIGATLVDNSTGAVYVFEKDADGNWQETGKLDPGMLAEGDSFGRSLALAGDFAFVGSAGHNNGQGAVFAFMKGADGYAFHSKLSNDTVEEGGFFGLNIAAEGSTLLVAAPMNGQSEDGAPNGDVFSYTYDSASDAWMDAGALQKFPGVFDNSQFGMGLAMEGSRAVVGMPQLGGGIGGAVVYSNNGGGWGFSGVLLPFVVSNGGSGSFTAIAGDDVWLAGAGTLFSYEGGATGFTSASVLLGGQTGGATSAAVDGNLAVVGSGNADSGAGRVFVLEMGDEGWDVAAEFETAFVDLYPSVTGGQVECAEGVAEGFDCSEIDMLSFVSLGDLGGGKGIRMNDVWGWTDPETGREYALAGRTDGTSFVDVTDAENPMYLGNLQMTEGANAASWRDVKVFDNHVYIVADGSGQHGMQVFDLTRLRDVTEPQEFDTDAFYGEIGSAHNIVINESTGFAYAVGVNSGGETCGGGLHMIDINSPKEPTFVGCFGHEGTGRSGTGYSHDAQCIIYAGPDTEHGGQEICFGGNETAVSISDVTDKENPIALSSAEYPNAGYTHQGWITDDHEYFYVNDELDEVSGGQSLTRTLIFDVRDLDDPVLVREFLGETAASDHNLYIQGNYMYQSNYSAGLRILDISDPGNPVEVGYFDVNPSGDNEAGFNGTWSNYPYFESGTIIVTGIESGLFMLKKRQIDL
ncbi:MAG: choice-of-anchor B family protein [Rhodothermales bacterium]|nr:choice-of-anchor B family protein [Rhodothermales bacterium]MDG2016667.1 choice-of-anchor B family protein [Rhodothermales bacterium]